MFTQIRLLWILAIVATTVTAEDPGLMHISFHYMTFQSTLDHMVLFQVFLGFCMFTVQLCNISRQIMTDCLLSHPELQEDAQPNFIDSGSHFKTFTYLHHWTTSDTQVIMHQSYTHTFLCFRVWTSIGTKLLWSVWLWVSWGTNITGTMWHVPSRIHHLIHKWVKLWTCVLSPESNTPAWANKASDVECCAKNEHCTHFLGWDCTVMETQIVSFLGRILCLSYCVLWKWHPYSQNDSK